MINPKEKMLDQLKSQAVPFSAADETDIVAVAMAFGEEIQKHGDPAMAIYALKQQLAEANLAYKNIQNGILIKEANLNYFAEQNKQLKKLLREASGPMSYGHWSSDFRNKVKEALK